MRLGAAANHVSLP